MQLTPRREVLVVRAEPAIDRRIALRLHDDERDVTHAMNRVTASGRSGELVVPRAEFIQGVVAFLCGVGSAVKARLGAAIEWESMAPLKEVMRVCGS